MEKNHIKDSNHTWDNSHHYTQVQEHVEPDGRIDFILHAEFENILKEKPDIKQNVYTIDSYIIGNTEEEHVSDHYGVYSEVQH